MIPGKYIWMNGNLTPWEDAKTHVMLTHSLHYGSAVFEGVRFYDTTQGNALFRNIDHVDRIFYSSSFMAMDIPYSKEEIAKAIIEVVKNSGLNEGYVRPIFYIYDKVGVSPLGGVVHIAIGCWSWGGGYLSADSVKIKTSTWRRIPQNADVCNAKICGHYFNAALANMEAVKGGYDEAIMLDQNGNISEGSAENLFIVKNGKIYTPKDEGNFLPGITRSSVMTIAKDLGYEIIEKDLVPEDVYNADEAFFTGTAAEVQPIESLDDKPIKNRIGEVTSHLKNTFTDIVNGKNEKYLDWLTFVK